jgi:hypothetical protein
MMPLDSLFEQNPDLNALSLNLPKEIVREIVEQDPTAQTWQNLNLAISQTSGFKRWQRSLHLVDRFETKPNQKLAEDTLGKDHEEVTKLESSEFANPELTEIDPEDVSRYLRETLETLAY